MIVSTHLYPSTPSVQFNLTSRLNLLFAMHKEGYKHEKFLNIILHYIKSEKVLERLGDTKE